MKINTIIRIVVCSWCMIVLGYYGIFACGGGMVPYIPSSGSTGNSASAGGQFFIIDKSVTTSMLDAKSLQPLLRNIVNSGNERNVKNITKSEKTDTQKPLCHDTCTTGKPMTAMDSLHMQYHGSNAEPVLNLHKLH